MTLPDLSLLPDITLSDDEPDERYVDIEFQEGLLNIDWNTDNNIYMTGKISEVKKITVSI